MHLRPSPRRRRGVTRGDVVVLIVLVGTTALLLIGGRLRGRETPGWRDAAAISPRSASAWPSTTR